MSHHGWWTYHDRELWDVWFSFEGDDDRDAAVERARELWEEVAHEQRRNPSPFDPSHLRPASRVAAQSLNRPDDEEE